MRSQRMGKTTAAFPPKPLLLPRLLFSESMKKWEGSGGLSKVDRFPVLVGAPPQDSRPHAAVIRLSVDAVGEPKN